MRYAPIIFASLIFVVHQSFTMTAYGDEISSQITLGEATAMAEAYRDGADVEKDEEKALEIFEQIGIIWDEPTAYIEAGRIAARLSLSDSSRYQQAKDFSEKAAHLGSVEGAMSAALLYTGSEDYEEANKFLLMAAQAGLAKAQHEYALNVYKGVGVVQNKPIAISWFVKAADQNYPPSTWAAGRAFFLGEGVPQSFSKAFTYLSAAARFGIPEGQMMLGSMYQEAIGVQGDKVLAHMWLNIAAANGVEPASVRRDKLAESMSLEDVETAQGLASVCIESGYSNCFYPTMSKQR